MGVLAGRSVLAASAAGPAGAFLSRRASIRMQLAIVVFYYFHHGSIFQSLCPPRLCCAGRHRLSGGDWLARACCCRAVGHWGGVRAACVESVDGFDDRRYGDCLGRYHHVLRGGSFRVGTFGISLPRVNESGDLHLALGGVIL